VTIELNGETREIGDGTTVGALIRAETGSARGSAAVVDGEVVPRSTWDDHELRDGQVVELITAVQGG
jgi:sulfur carrier protein